MSRHSDRNHITSEKNVDRGLEEHLHKHPDVHLDENIDQTLDGVQEGQALSRRELLMRGGVVSAAGLLGATASAQAQAKQQPGSGGGSEVNAKMPTATLGRTGMTVSRLALGGSWNVDGEVVGVAFERGVNYIDTAESYNGGQSERAFGQILQQAGATGHSKARQKLWVVTKTHDHFNLERRLPRSLARMQQDYVDCYYMHQVDDPKLPLNPDIKAMAQRLKKSGMTRFFGFSCHDAPLVECLNAAADSDFIDVVMFRYDCHYYKRDDLNRAIDRCVKAGIGLVAMKTQVGGMTLPDKFNPFKQRGLNQHQAAIKAVAVDERIASICSEMTHVEHVQQNAAAVASKLTVAEAEAIQTHARLVSHLWCRGCDHVCRAASGTGWQIAVADSLRFLMYHDHYNKRAHARRLFADLPAAERDLAAIQAADWHAAENACPYHVPIAKLMERVRERLA